MDPLNEFAELDLDALDEQRDEIAAKDEQDLTSLKDQKPTRIDTTGLLG